MTKVISCDLNHVWSQQQITGCFSLGKIEKDYLRGKTFVLWEIFLPFFPLEKTTITYQHTDQYIMHTFLKQGHDVYAKDVYMCIYIKRWAHPHPHFFCKVIHKLTITRNAFFLACKHFCMLSAHFQFGATLHHRRNACHALPPL